MRRWLVRRAGGGRAHGRLLLTTHSSRPAAPPALSSPPDCALYFLPRTLPLCFAPLSLLLVSSSLPPWS